MSRVKAKQTVALGDNINLLEMKQMITLFPKANFNSLEVLFLF